jgi:cobalt-zinc-cadmium efflux system protein
MGHDHHHHHHGHTRRTAAEKQRLQLVLGLTSVFLVVEVVGGIASRSLALLADAGHMVTDVAGLALALVAIKFAERPATPERTYGYYRVEILAALTNAAVLAGVSFFILFEAWSRLRQPPEVQTGLMLAVAGLALAVNVAGVMILHTASSESLNIKGVYFELLGDMFAAIGVIIAGLIMRFTGWYYADPLISACIALVILPRTYYLVREAVGVLLEGTPADVNLTALREAIGRCSGVVGVHDLHVWTLTSGVHAMSAHAVLGEGADHSEALTSIQQCVASHFKIVHVTVQIEARRCEEETHV